MLIVPNAETVPNFPDSIPIVFGGGTSLVKGFMEVVGEQFNQDEFKILDLDTLLTPGRNNGVHSMLKKVKFYSRKNANNPKSNEAA